MSRKPGRYVQVTSGKHLGKRGFAYNRDQEPAVVKAGKVAVWVPEQVQTSLFPDQVPDVDASWRKVLFEPSRLKLLGFID